MNKKLFIFAIVFVVVFGFLVSAKPSWKTPSEPNCPITDTTDFVYYGQTGRGGVGDLSASWINHFLSWWQSQDPSMEFVELDSGHVKGDCDLDNFPNLKLYIQPGGNAYWMQRTLRSEGKNNILSYINSGKAYLGICAGAYYAAGDYFWQGSYYDWSNLLGVYPTLEGSITDIADYDENPGYAVTSLSSGHDMIYYGGPTRGWRDTSGVYPGVSLNSFSAIPGDLPAAIRDNNLLLMSVHPEAYENDGITGLTSEQRVENYIWFANQINDLAGTNFYVPESQMVVCGDLVCEGDETWQNCPSDCEEPQPVCGNSVCEAGEDEFNCPADCEAPYEPVCGDGICEFDENEFNCAADCSLPVETEIFYDGFENGLNWYVYGPGNSWIVSTDSPYSGSYSAMSKQSGAGDPTYMQTFFNSSGADSLVFEYERKLIGLDAADDFEVAYFDGSWHVLEHVSSTTDSDYVHKSFILPGNALGVRFMCEAGAVSEMCFVDEVKVTTN